MSDIRNYFKKSPTLNKKRTREQIDDEEIIPVSKSKPKLSTKTSMEKVVSQTKTNINTTPQKKLKIQEIDPIEKRKRSENYKSFMNRGGPDAPGSKTIPDGEKNCLKNLTFVISGVLESLERDECKKLIEKYTGRVTITISGKTNYLIVGRDASEAKTDKARQTNIKIISEDDLFEMIRTRPGDESPSKKQLSTTSKSSSMTVKRKSSSTVSQSIDDPGPIITPKISVDESNLLWVDKYKPQTIKHLIGQQGEKSCVQKLIIWLRDWYKHHGHSDEKVKAKSSFTFNRNEDPTMFKAALLSGPPGIGKTTTAQLVCQHLNFEYIEKNASDQRSKKSMTNLSSDTYSVVNFSNKTSSLSKYVLIMDEVDGVSGNADRGGIQELILLIKRTRIPIICICNDRQHKKIRSLANYCYDLRFHRPTIQQIRAGMLTILHRENIQNIKQEILDEIIESCNHDIRQIIHTLNLWSIQNITNTNKIAAKMIEKTRNTNPFELCRLSFSDEYREKSLTDKSDLFFYDYQLIPLLIQENYLQCQPHLSTLNKQKRTLTDIEHLNLISKAADSISLGDICSQMIFSKNESWSLLPYQAIFSTVAPCSYVRGHLRSMVNFSSYFGQRSRTNKNERLLNEIEKHICLKITSTNKQQFNLDYLSYLSQALISPLKNFKQDKGIEQCISLLDDYYLNRDDFQTIIELNTWSNTGRNQYEQLDTQTKSLLTRNYNKTNHRTPYAIIDMKKIKKSKGLMDEESDDEQQEENIITDDNNIEEDAMIKPAKKPIINNPKKKSRMK
ncbi:unnamed protein product [Rotaria sordida]|uniref:Replication factor C subunit 1 n=1 Tax=Rotaria sordida TaxID=392033 RepID=A0A818TCR9_9BILA|nr:unnamed protein product [Rotaria sordida]CAF0867928.1 unnamed protein product [Rotaria sordida]CAF3680084.1 unnamed protein product [Rotaria sordida]